MRSRHLHRIRVLTFSAAVLLVASPTWAQESASVSGSISEAEFESPLARVRVSLLGTAFVAYSDNDGLYTIANVPPGQYTLVFTAPGFKTVQFADIALAAGGVLEQDVVLTLAGILEEVTVTATRDELMLMEVPQNVAIITADVIEKTAGNTPVDYLDKLPGVDASKSGAGISRGITFLSINGYDDTYVKQMVDGVDVSNNVSNWGLIQEFPIELIESIEVVKGGSSSVWGSGMAGVINVVTKQPRRISPPAINLRTAFSSWGEMDFEGGNAVGNSGNYGKGALDVTGMLGDVGYFLYGSYLSSAGFVEHSKERLTKVGGKLSYEMQPGESLSGFVNYSLSDGESGHIFVTLPGTSLFFWNYFDALRLETELATARYVNETNENLDFNFNGKFSTFDFLSVRTNVEDALLGPAGAVAETATADRVFGFTGQVNYRYSDTGTLTAGFDYYNKNADFSGFDLGHLILNEYQPYANVTQHVGDALVINAGLRYNGNDLFETQLSPQIGAVVNLSDYTLIRANVGRGYQTPDFFQLTGETFFGIAPNPGLQPERAWLYSAGFETNEIPWLWLKSSVYLHKMTDGIIVGFLPTGQLQWLNRDTFTRKGVEAEIGIQSQRGVFASFGYNYNKHEDTSGDEAEILFWLPTRTWKVSAGYSNPSIGFNIFAAGKYIWYNQQGSTFDLLQANDKNWVLDLKIAKEFRLSPAQSITVHADVYNITDTAYWERIDLPFARRWVDFGVKLSIR